MAKIFAMNDTDWMAGEDLESCIEAYLADFCGGLSREEAVDDPEELTLEQCNKLTFVDGDDKRTFTEQLSLMVASGVSFPAFFASTEY